MKLHELSPAPGSTKEVKRIGVATALVTVRPQVRVIRDRRLVPELPDPVSKVVRCLYTDVFLREVSLTETLRKSLLSM